MTSASIDFCGGELKFDYEPIGLDGGGIVWRASVPIKLCSCCLRIEESVAIVNRSLLINF